MAIILSSAPASDADPVELSAEVPLVLRTGDDAPPITFVTGNALPGARVRLVTDSPDLPSADMEVTDADRGECRYDFGEGELVTPGRYTAEVEVTYADRRVQTFPTDGRLVLEVLDDLD